MIASTVRGVPGQGPFSQLWPQPSGVTAVRQRGQHSHTHPLQHILRSGCDCVRARAVSSGTGKGTSKVSVAPTPPVPAEEPEVWAYVDSYHFLMANGSHMHARVSASSSGDVRIVVRLEYLSTRKPCFLHWCFSPTPSKFSVLCYMLLTRLLCFGNLKACRGDQGINTTVICRGLYRGSLEADWMLPKAIISKDSVLREDLQAIHTPLVRVEKPSGDSRDQHYNNAPARALEAAVHLPKGVLPCFVTGAVYVEDPLNPLLLVPKHSRFVSIPVGVSRGCPTPLGATVSRRLPKWDPASTYRTMTPANGVSSPATAAPPHSSGASTVSAAHTAQQPADSVSVNFSVVSRHARAFRPTCQCLECP